MRLEAGREGTLSLYAVLISWLALFGAYLRMVPGAVYFEDSPELLTCAWMLGNTHPPGYPLMCLLGRLALLAPVGSPAFRFNVLGAAFGAAAAVALGAAAYVLASRFSGRLFAAWAAVFAAGVWGFSGSFWWQALIGDKYAVFYFLFAALAFLSLRGAFSPKRAEALSAAFVFGAALTHHPYAVFSAPLVLLAVVRFVASAKGRVRAVLLVLLAALLPFSLKIIYPPARSAAGVLMDWGKPRVFSRLVPYLGAKLYHESFSAAADSEAPGRLGSRVRLFGILLKEEIPPALLLGVLPGLFIVWKSAPWVAAALLLSMALAAGYSFNFFGEVVRWYEPFYALVAAVSAVGFAWSGWVLLRFRKRTAGLVLVAAIAVLAVVMQVKRNLARNSLSGFYGAHDLARNMAISMPRGTVYLGIGDFDLFPLWELVLLERERTDLLAVGLASFVDPQLSGVGMMDRLLAELGGGKEGPETLAILLKRAYSRDCVMVAGVAYQEELQKLMPFLDRRVSRGVVARLSARWDPGLSAANARRLFRAYSMRGLTHARSGAWGDPLRPRDEVARAAFMCYPVSVASLGDQLFGFGYNADAAWAFDRARRLLAFIAGPADLPEIVRGAHAVMRIRRDRAALSLLFQRLAEVYAARGVAPRAEEFMDSAAAWAQ